MVWVAGNVEGRAVPKVPLSNVIIMDEIDGCCPGGTQMAAIGKRVGCGRCYNGFEIASHTRTLNTVSKTLCMTVRSKG